MNMQTSFDITLAVQLAKKKEKLLLHFAILTLYRAFTTEILEDLRLKLI